jgi:hypothetical protein
MYKPLTMAYLRRFQGFLYFLMVGKVMDLGCVFEWIVIKGELGSPVKI